MYSVYTSMIKYVQHHVLATSPTSAFTLSWLWNLFAPTQTLLHTYNCHDHHHHHHHHIITSSHHHITIIITLKFATPSEQYVDWGNNIDFIFIRDQNFAIPYEQYVDWGKNINFLFIRDQNSPPLWTKNIDWDNNINFIFIATWSQTRRNIRVAANMFKTCLDHENLGFTFPILVEKKGNSWWISWVCRSYDAGLGAHRIPWRLCGFCSWLQRWERPSHGYHFCSPGYSGILWESLGNIVGYK